MAPVGSSQGSQKPATGLYLEPADPDSSTQIQFLTQTLNSQLRTSFFLSGS